MKHFKDITTTPPNGKPELINAVIMGRNTWESIPAKFRPLPMRTNVILTQNSKYSIECSSKAPTKTLIASSLNDAILQLSKLDNIGHIFVIGGGKVYQDAIDQDLLSRIYYTEIRNLSTDVIQKMDVFFPHLEDSKWKQLPFCRESEKQLNVQWEGGEVKSEGGYHRDDKGDQWKTNVKNGLQYRFLDIQRINTNPLEEEKIELKEKAQVEEGAHVNMEEMQYLDLCRDIIENGVSAQFCCP